jgi:glycosyltransferase involved in cell wall biosynthesis
MTREPTLTAIVPTPGQGRPLRRCLQSLVMQLRPGDECLVVGDCVDGPLPEVEALVASFGPLFHYLPFNGGEHSWGHFEINYGIEHAKGDYLVANDDDDIFAPGAFAIIRRVIRELPAPRPLLFRFQSYLGGLYWNEGCRHSDGRLVARQDFIGGHCAVFPNIPERLGRWTARYQGDFDFVRSTLDLWPNKDDDAIWREEIIAIARPKDESL